MGPANKTVCGFDNAENPQWEGCPNWQVTNLSTYPAWSYGINNWTHAGYLELAAAFIPWYKAPPGSPMPPIQPSAEAGYFFYNLQAINNSCPNDPVGPYAKYSYNDPAYPLEDVVYLHTMLSSPANVTITSGTRAPVLFNLSAGISYLKTPWSAGKQSFRVERAGAVLTDVTGTESINTTEETTDGCYPQTFSGVIRWAAGGAPSYGTRASEAGDAAARSFESAHPPPLSGSASAAAAAAAAAPSAACAAVLTPDNVCACCVCTTVASNITRMDCSGGGKGVGITSSMLTRGTFAGFNNLVYLDLSSNQITTLPSGIFSGLPLNGALWLAGNQISALPADIFSGMIHMDFLGLHRNQLAALPSGIFKGCTNLYHVFLDHNYLCSYDGLNTTADIQTAIMGETELPLVVVAWEPQACGAR